LLARNVTCARFEEVVSAMSRGAPEQGRLTSRVTLALGTFSLPTSDREAYEADHGEHAATPSADVETAEQTYAALDVRVASMQPASSSVEGTPMALVGIPGMRSDPDGLGLAYRGGIAGSRRRAREGMLRVGTGSRRLSPLLQSGLRFGRGRFRGV
jgi:hypothetical protein